MLRTFHVYVSNSHHLAESVSCCFRCNLTQKFKRAWVDISLKTHGPCCHGTHILNVSNCSKLIGLFFVYISWLRVRDCVLAVAEALVCFESSVRINKWHRIHVSKRIMQTSTSTSLTEFGLIVFIFRRSIYSSFSWQSAHASKFKSKINSIIIGRIEHGFTFGCDFLIYFTSAC